MKKLLLAAIAAMITAFSANAQVKIESPHPDLDVKITRCAYANGIVVIDMLITNFGVNEDVRFSGTSSHRSYKTTAYDDDGNQYGYGNTDVSAGFTNEKLYNGMFGSGGVFPQDIPLKFRFQITNINPNATKFTLLSIPVESNGAMNLRSEESRLIIRNLEWVK